MGRLRSFVEKQVHKRAEVYRKRYGHLDFPRAIRDLRKKLQSEMREADWRIELIKERAEGEQRKLSERDKYDIGLLLRSKERSKEQLTELGEMTGDQAANNQ
jgi:hypothetical protein